jgi:hypothetical protein
VSLSELIPYERSGEKSTLGGYMKFLLCSALIVFTSIPILAVNPVPFISQPLAPTTKPPGIAGFVLTVNGAAFVNGAVVNWNGSPRKTQFVNVTQLKANILSSDICHCIYCLGHGDESRARRGHIKRCFLPDH